MSISYIFLNPQNNRSKRQSFTILTIWPFLTNREPSHMLLAELDSASYLTSAYISKASCSRAKRPSCQLLNSSHSLFSKVARIFRNHPPTIKSA